ncbi:hypothetical protein Tco_1291955, partial [Tanacetum coccineum]
MISCITKNSKRVDLVSVAIEVRKFYRPENLSSDKAYRSDIREGESGCIGDFDNQDQIFALNPFALNINGKDVKVLIYFIFVTSLFIYIPSESSKECSYVPIFQASSGVQAFKADLLSLVTTAAGATQSPKVTTNDAEQRTNSSSCCTST